MLISSITEMVELKEYEKWFRMSIAGNFIDDASSYTLNGIQFFQVSFGCRRE